MKIKCIFGKHDWEFVNVDSVSNLLEYAPHIRYISSDVLEMLEESDINPFGYVADKVCLRCGKVIKEYTYVKDLLKLLETTGTEIYEVKKAIKKQRQKKAKKLLEDDK